MDAFVLQPSDKAKLNYELVEWIVEKNYPFNFGEKKLNIKKTSLGKIFRMHLRPCGGLIPGCMFIRQGPRRLHKWHLRWPHFPGCLFNCLFVKRPKDASTTSDSILISVPCTTLLALGYMSKQNSIYSYIIFMGSEHHEKMLVRLFWGAPLCKTSHPCYKSSRMLIYLFQGFESFRWTHPNVVLPHAVQKPRVALRWTYSRIPIYSSTRPKDVYTSDTCLCPLQHTKALGYE